MSSSVRLNRNLIRLTTRLDSMWQKSVVYIYIYIDICITQSHDQAKR